MFDGCKFWRLNDQVYAPDEGATIFEMNDDEIELDVGLYSIIIPPAGFIEKDSILFKPLASNYVYGANLQDIHDSRSGGNVTYYRSNTVFPSQGLASDISSEGVILYGYEGSFACWNIQSPLEDSNVVGTHRGIHGWSNENFFSYYFLPVTFQVTVKSSTQATIMSRRRNVEPCKRNQWKLFQVLVEKNSDLPFVSGLKIYDEYKTGPSGENVWIAITNLNTYLSGNLNVTEVNFRILQGNVADLVRGTNCEPQQHGVVKTLEDLSFSKYEE